MYRQTGSPLHAATDTNVDDLNFTFLNENRHGNIGELMSTQYRDAFQKSDRAKLDMSLPLKRAAEKMDQCRIDLRSPVRESPKHLKSDLDARKKAMESAVLKQMVHERPSRPQNHERLMEDGGECQNHVKGSATAVITPSSGVGTHRIESQSVDPQLHLLDFQLRNILKPSLRGEECMYSGVHCAEQGTSSGPKDGRCAEGSHMEMMLPTGGKNAPGRGSEEVITSIVKKQCIDELLNNTMETGEDGGRVHPANTTPGIGWKSVGLDDTVNPETLGGRLGRPADFILRRHSAREDNDDEKEARDEKREVKRLSLVDCSQLQHGHGSITFGNVEEISNTNAQGEDALTTNAYLDDHATRAAPYTLASQFISLGFSDEEGGDEETESIRADEMKGQLGRGASASYMERGTKGLHLLKQVHENGEKFSRQVLVWGRSSSQEAAHVVDNNNHESVRFADSEKTDVSVVPKATSSEAPTPVTEHRPRKLGPDEIPRPKFSTRSPSSPARLSTTSLEQVSPVEVARLRLLSLEMAELQLTGAANHSRARLSSADGAKVDKDGLAPAFGVLPSSGAVTPLSVAPLAVQEDDEESVSIGCEAPDATKQRKTVCGARPSDRGYVNSESPRHLALLMVRARDSSASPVRNQCQTNNHQIPATEADCGRSKGALGICSTGAHEPVCLKSNVYSDLDIMNKNVERPDITRLVAHTGNQVERLDNLSLSLSMPNVTVCQGRSQNTIHIDVPGTPHTENSESLNMSESRQHIKTEDASLSNKKSSDSKSVIHVTRGPESRTSRRLRDVRPLMLSHPDHQRSLSVGTYHSHPDMSQIQVIADDEILSSMSSPERSYYPKPPTGNVSRKALVSSHAR